MQSSLVAIAQCIYTDIPYTVKSKDCLPQLISFAASIPNNVHTSHSITLLAHYTSPISVNNFNTTSRCLACQGMQEVHAAHAAILLLMIAGAIESEK